MQNKIPFSVEPDKLKRLAYNDCVYAWLLVHSFENKGEYHCYIYKNSFTFQQIAKDIHRSRQTVSRRFNELLRTEDNPFGFITEDIYCGEKVYKLPYSNPFQYLHGETVEATDLRAGAAMLLAGMIAKGTTTITNIEHILRGYENIVTKLTTVGANIKIIDE